MKKTRKKRKPGMGKGKGGGFERRICKELSLWVSHGKREDLFWRSAMSGGRSTVARKKGKHLQASAGDISAIDPLGAVLTEHFFIECKSVANLHLHRFVTEHSGLLAEFWEKACDQAFDHRKRPMLICKQNRYPILLLLSKRLVGKPRAKLRCKIYLLLGDTEKCYIYLFSEVLEHRFRLVK